MAHKIGWVGRSEHETKLSRYFEKDAMSISDIPTKYIMTDTGIKKNPLYKKPKRFWTDEWQAMEREVEEDIIAGRVETFDTMEDFLRDLNKDAQARKFQTGKAG